MNYIQLTKEGLMALQHELDELLKDKKPHAIERLSKARAMGDLSENSEYSAAKEDLGVVEGRVRELQELIKHAQVVQVASGGHEVKLGSRVVVRANENTQEFSIVGEFEADPMAGKLSITSPIGKALIGHKEDEEVTVVAPAGRVIYKIVKLK